MIGVIVFAMLGALATLLFGALYVAARFNLPKWCTLPALIAIWLAWAAALMWLGQAWLLP